MIEKDGKLDVRFHPCTCAVAASMHVPSIGQSCGHRRSKGVSTHYCQIQGSAFLSFARCCSSGLCLEPRMESSSLEVEQQVLQP